MGAVYTIKNQQVQYFITCTMHQWGDVFTRKEYIDTLLEASGFANPEKGLQVYAWVLMSNTYT